MANSLDVFQRNRHSNGRHNGRHNGRWLSRQLQFEEESRKMMKGSKDGHRGAGQDYTYVDCSVEEMQAMDPRPAQWYKRAKT